MRALLLALLTVALPAAAAEKLNLLFLTTDDMSCDSVGAWGCKLADTTPHLDRLAARALRFNHAFVQVGNCMPSRNVMGSGRYPHNNRVEGFYPIKDPDYPVLADLMKAGGWFTGIRGKVPHATPYSPYPGWDAVLDTLPDGQRAHIKDPASYHACVQDGIARAKAAQKPFFLNINISDPHKPFYNEKGRGDPHVPSRVFSADEVPVPGFLPDDPEVRAELALYYSTVRRADDCVGQVLRALEEAGELERTVILFLSDHGMPLPFAKTQLYYHSTRTPMMVVWPGVTRPGSIDDDHLVSAVDLLPTLLDVFRLPHPDGLDGRSFAPVLRGEKQAGREYVVTEYNENSGGNRSPMRSILTKEHAYLFNPWSNGERVMRTATQGTVTYRRMQALAKTDPQVAARLHLIDHRLPEELYHYAYDPDALTNLLGKPEVADVQARLTRALEDWMQRTRDPLLAVFRQRHDPAVREAFMQQAQTEADQRRQQGKGKAKKASGPRQARTATGQPPALPGGEVDLQLQAPAKVTRGGTCTVHLHHRLPESLGPQKLHVTLKAANGRRLERQIFDVQGDATLSVFFPLPADTSDKTVSFAAFLGEEFPKNLKHVQSEPVPVE